MISGAFAFGLQMVMPMTLRSSTITEEYEYG